LWGRRNAHPCCSGNGRVMRERFFEHDGKIIHHRVSDAEPAMRRVERLREVPQSALPMSDSRLVASVPMHVITLWLNEAGVKWDDPAAKEVIKRKLMSGEASAFRVDGRSW